MHLPKQTHWEATLRVVRSLKGNPGWGILLQANCDLKLSGYYDSDWVGCPLTRKSLTGYFILLWSSPISWKTKKNNTLYLVRQHKLNIDPYPLQRVSSNGWKGYYTFLMLYILNLWICIVIVKQLYISPLTRFFMNAQSTLRWIIISFTMRYMMAILQQYMCILLDNQLMLLLKL